MASFYEQDSLADELKLLELMCKKRKQLDNPDETTKTKIFFYAYTALSGFDEEGLMLVRTGVYAKKLNKFRAEAAKLAKENGASGSKVSVGRVLWMDGRIKLRPDAQASRGEVKANELRKGLKSIATTIGGATVALKQARFADDEAVDATDTLTKEEKKAVKALDAEFAALLRANPEQLEREAEEAEALAIEAMSGMLTDLEEALADFEDMAEFMTGRNPKAYLTEALGVVKVEYDQVLDEARGFIDRLYNLMMSDPGLDEETRAVIDKQRLDDYLTPFVPVAMARAEAEAAVSGMRTVGMTQVEALGRGEFRALKAAIDECERNLDEVFQEDFEDLALEYGETMFLADQAKSFTRLAQDTIDAAMMAIMW